ncbi:hypothetical protein TeGR_g8540, partial [Tetraparma gracilis]
YLVDELTGEPMYDSTGIYPINIETKSELVDAYMPMMQVGLQAAAVANGAASLVNVFCPFVPSTLVPKSIMEKAAGNLKEEVTDSAEVIARLKAEISTKDAKLSELAAQARASVEQEESAPRKLEEEAADSAEVIARLKAEISAKDAKLSELAAQARASVERLDEFKKKLDARKGGGVRAGTLYKQSKWRKAWEQRTVTLDSSGNLTWDGGAGHKGFVTLREGDRVVPVNQLDFQVEARDRTIAFRAGNVAEAGQWMQWIGEFVGGDTPLPPPPPL